MDKKKIYKSIVFLLVGLVIFWYVFKDSDLKDLAKEIKHFNWWWIVLSVLLNIFSHYIRAVRWKLMFKPLNLNPRVTNLFLADVILAFANQIIPRGGEIARLGVIKKYEKISFPKLIGIALVERFTDFSILILIFISLIIWQFGLFQELLNLPQINVENFNLKIILIVLFSIIVLITVSYIIIQKIILFDKIKQKLKTAIKDIREGFSSFKSIDRKFLFFTLSIIVYAIWFVMFYVLFFAYSQTENLSFKEAAFTFGLATMAFLLPIQSGVGAWHFVVIHCLLLIGVDIEAGKAFSLVAHAATNLVYIPIGLIIVLLMQILNRNNFFRKQPKLLSNNAIV